MTRFSIDSNILIYAEGTGDAAKRTAAIDIVRRIGFGNIVLSMQAVGEATRWMINRAKLERKLAVSRIGWWLDRCIPLPVTVQAFENALRLVESHAIQVWDAVILASSAEAEADVLLSEDMQHGFRWSNVTIINPFLLSEDDLTKLVPPTTLH